MELSGCCIIRRCEVYSALRRAMTCRRAIVAMEYSRSCKTSLHRPFVCHHSCNMECSYLALFDSCLSKATRNLQFSLCARLSC